MSKQEKPNSEVFRTSKSAECEESVRRQEVREILKQMRKEADRIVALILDETECCLDEWEAQAMTQGQTGESEPVSDSPNVYERINYIDFNGKKIRTRGYIPEDFAEECRGQIINDEKELHQLSVSALLSMSKDERGELLKRLFDGCIGVFSLTQVQELWRIRKELDEGMFRCMIDSLFVHDGCYEPRYLDICPFTGLPHNAEVSGWYGSTWMDQCRFNIHDSVAKDLINLAHNVGVGVETLTIMGENGVLFNHSSGHPIGSAPINCEDFEDLKEKLSKGEIKINIGDCDFNTLHVHIVNNIGALDEKDIGEPYDYFNDIPDPSDSIVVEIVTPEGTRFLSNTG